MSFRDLLGETLRTLRAHTLRTALTMFGIAWGIVSITLMVAAGEGLRAGQQKVAELYPASRAAAVDPTEALRFEAGG